MHNEVGVGYEFWFQESADLKLRASLPIAVQTRLVQKETKYPLPNLLS